MRKVRLTYFSMKLHDFACGFEVNAIICARWTKVIRGIGKIQSFMSVNLV